MAGELDDGHLQAVADPKNGRPLSRAYWIAPILPSTPRSPKRAATIRPSVPPSARFEPRLFESVASIHRC